MELMEFKFSGKTTHKVGEVVTSDFDRFKNNITFEYILEHDDHIEFSLSINGGEPFTKRIYAGNTSAYSTGFFNIVHDDADAQTVDDLKFTSLMKAGKPPRGFYQQQKQVYLRLESMNTILIDTGTPWKVRVSQVLDVLGNEKLDRTEESELPNQYECHAYLHIDIVHDDDEEWSTTLTLSEYLIPRYIPFRADAHMYFNMHFNALHNVYKNVKTINSQPHRNREFFCGVIKTNLQLSAKNDPIILYVNVFLRCSSKYDTQISYEIRDTVINDRYCLLFKVHPFRSSGYLSLLMYGISDKYRCDTFIKSHVKEESWGKLLLKFIDHIAGAFQLKYIKLSDASYVLVNGTEVSIRYARTLGKGLAYYEARGFVPMTTSAKPSIKMITKYRMTKVHLFKKYGKMKASDLEVAQKYMTNPTVREILQNHTIHQIYNAIFDGYWGGDTLDSLNKLASELCTAFTKDILKYLEDNKDQSTSDEYWTLSEMFDCFDDHGEMVKYFAGHSSSLANSLYDTIFSQDTSEKDIEILYKQIQQNHAQDLRRRKLRKGPPLIEIV